MRKASLCVAIVILSCGFVMGGNIKVLYHFGTNGGATDGSQPKGEVAFDMAGNIYGTTVFGGNITSNCPSGCGTVFELSPISGGGWSEKVLLAFVDGQDGQGPQSGLILDAEGNLYGTTGGSGGGNCLAPDCGTVFELSPSGGGTWTETVLYAFANSVDGYAVYLPVVFDAEGNLYGVTAAGGSTGGGTAFELSPPPLPGGSWYKTVLYTFCQVGGQQCLDGTAPSSGLTSDGHGNLYGITEKGGLYGPEGWGLAYELSPNSGGTWTDSVIYNFGGTNGVTPFGRVTFDAFGNLYGTLVTGGLKARHCDGNGGGFDFCGAAFRLAPRTGGGWSEVSFRFDGADGGNPSNGLALDGSSFYGTTVRGGSGYGTVFQVTGGTESVLQMFHCPPKGATCPDGSLPGAITLNAGSVYGVTLYGGKFGQGVVFEITP